MSVRVRFAPNPSGELHMGSAHTALFNWLFARHHGGTFILRIEDTDPQMARPEFIEPITEGLRWLGLEWDEGYEVGGPHGSYRQSERRDIHHRALERLIEGGHVYRCWCAREDVLARGTKTGYDRHCRDRSDEPAGPYALRFRTPDDGVTVDDLIHGSIQMQHAQLQDFVVARSDGTPTFELANVADDTDMRITHAIRGVDLLSSAGRNLLIFRALGEQPPAYAHLPLILGEDRAKLSKRHMAIGMHAFRAGGYLAEAVVNFLALIGWSSVSMEEILPLRRIVEEFDLDRIHPANAVFDRKKLDWINQQWIQRLEHPELERRVLELHPEVPQDVLRRAMELELIQTRIETLSEVPDAVRYLHERPAIDPQAKTMVLGAAEAGNVLDAAASRLSVLEPWTVDAIESTLQQLAEHLSLNRRKAFAPVRVAVSGSTVSLPLYESIFLIGRHETIARLRAAR